jgi:uncharacterized protein YfbU (UPF0304 family)
MATCAICFDHDVNLYNLCVDDKPGHSKTCKSCVKDHIANIIGSAYNGICPAIYCPCVHSDNTKKMLKYKLWSQIPEFTNLSEKFTELANGLLEFRCGRCHEHSSISVEFDISFSPASFLTLDEKFKNVNNELKSFIRGETSLNEAYQTILLELLSIDKQNVENNFKRLLAFIRNPERRVNLYLRYLRDYPKVRTNCCNAEHCFNCKIYGYHDGKTCEEMNETFCNDILNCPCCGIALVKSEGCDTITCICGMTFSWEWEMVSGVKYRRFLKKYPIDTNTHCAEILVQNNPKYISFSNWDINVQSYDEEVVWYSVHYHDVSKHLMNIFKNRYPNCPDQCCVVLPDDVKNNYWLNIGASKWRDRHRSQCDKLQNQHDLSVRSLFTSLVQEKDRPLEALKIVEHIYVICGGEFRMSEWFTILPDIHKSCLMWYYENNGPQQPMFQLHGAQKIQQFVYLYGKRTIKLKQLQSDESNSCQVMLDNDEHYKMFKNLISYVVSLFANNNRYPQKIIPNIQFRDLLDLNNPNKWKELCDIEEDADYDEEDYDDGDIPSIDSLDSFDNDDIVDDTLNITDNSKLEESYDNKQTKEKFDMSEINFDVLSKVPESTCSLKCVVNFLAIRERIYKIFNIDPKNLPKYDDFYVSGSKFTEERLNKLTWYEIIYALSWYVENRGIIEAIKTTDTTECPKYTHDFFKMKMMENCHYYRKVRESW